MVNTFKQVRLTAYRTADVLQLIEANLPTPAPGEVVIRVRAVGVNYSDILRRQNKYFQPTPLPYVLGAEAVGVIEALGEGVEAPYSTGTRVLAILPFGGGYGEYVRANAQFCIPLPPSIDDAAATGLFVQGSTAQLMMAEVAGKVAGKTVLITAAAGGVGSLLVQLGKMNGATVISAASSERKLAVCQALGADVTVNYTQSNWHEQVKAACKGDRVDIAFETVGGTIYTDTIRSLASGGHLIIYGCASGLQGVIHPEYFVDETIRQSGFNLAFYMTNKLAVWQEAIGVVIELVAQGQLRIETPKLFALSEAAEAHRQLEARQTTGKVVLMTT